VRRLWWPRHLPVEAWRTAGRISFDGPCALDRREECQLAKNSFPSRRTGFGPFCRRAVVLEGTETSLTVQARLGIVAVELVLVHLLCGLGSMWWGRMRLRCVAWCQIVASSYAHRRVRMRRLGASGKQSCRDSVSEVVENVRKVVEQIEHVQLVPTIKCISVPVDHHWLRMS